MEKIERAKDLVSNPETFNEGNKIYYQMCRNENLSPELRLMTLVSYVKNAPEEGMDMLYRFRDFLPFVKGDEYKSIVKILVQITRSTEFSSHERVMTAVSLWNNCIFNRCYICFADLANDRSIDVSYRVEATRYLVSSEDDENIQISQEALLEIIDNKEYSSSYRYEIIAGFIGRTGMSMMLNAGKLKVPYQEEFVYALQTNFFYNDINEPREKILSGQHLLQMRCVEDKEKTEISQALLDIAKDELLDVNIRADAADVVLRLGIGSSKAIARRIICSLGRSPSDHVQTVYSDSQNVHNQSIAECVSKFIERIIQETDVTIPPYQKVHQEICDLIQKSKLEPKNRISALESMNRVSIDTATFTENKVNLAEILTHVWIRIQKHPEEERLELEKRLVDELIDMSNTCSSGHCARFVNVLSTYDIALRISWEDQITANLSGRMEAHIRDIKDEDLRTKVALGMLDDADKEDREAYSKFVGEQLVLLEKELHDEFVGEGYISEEKFNNAFSDAKSKWEVKNEEKELENSTKEKDVENPGNSNL